MRVTAFVPLPRLVAQPEIISDAQADGSHSDPGDHQPASALLFATLLRFLGSAFGAFGGCLR